ncbi:MAG: hypothetical protein HY873_13175 [Chloroflexi bacterium]|nr:hypothetical protein [Chloroflexota bacterium]
MRKLFLLIGGFLALVAGAIAPTLVRFARGPSWARWMAPAVIITALVLSVVIPWTVPDAQHWRPMAVAVTAGTIAIAVLMDAENLRARVRRHRGVNDAPTASNVHRFALQFGGVGSSGASPGGRQTPG